MGSGSEYHRQGGEVREYWETDDCTTVGFGLFLGYIDNYRNLGKPQPYPLNCVSKDYPSHKFLPVNITLSIFFSPKDCLRHVWSLRDARWQERPGRTESFRLNGADQHPEDPTQPASIRYKHHYAGRWHFDLILMIALRCFFHLWCLMRFILMFPYDGYRSVN